MSNNSTNNQNYSQNSVEEQLNNHNNNSNWNQTTDSKPEQQRQYQKSGHQPNYQQATQQHTYRQQQQGQTNYQFQSMPNQQGQMPYGQQPQQPQGPNPMMSFIDVLKAFFSKSPLDAFKLRQSKAFTWIIFGLMMIVPALVTALTVNGLLLELPRMIAGGVGGFARNMIPSQIGRMTFGSFYGQFVWLLILLEGILIGLLHAMYAICKPQIKRPFGIIEIYATASYLPLILTIVGMLVGLISPVLVVLFSAGVSAVRYLLLYLGFEQRLGKSKTNPFWVFCGILILMGIFTLFFYYSGVSRGISSFASRLPGIGNLEDLFGF
ncbi:MAG: MFS transporter [Clostridiaceae bacterium]|nr:MFS transporter [Clostridiaceae bacterium]